MTPEEKLDVEPQAWQEAGHDHAPSTLHEAWGEFRAAVLALGRAILARVLVAGAGAVALWSDAFMAAVLHLDGLAVKLDRVADDLTE